METCSRLQQDNKNLKAAQTQQESEKETLSAQNRHLEHRIGLLEDELHQVKTTVGGIAGLPQDEAQRQRIALLEQDAEDREPKLKQAEER